MAEHLGKHDQTRRCQNPASFSFIWPGVAGRQLICAAHCEWLLKIAKAMGLDTRCLHLETEDKRINGGTCEQQVANIEPPLLVKEE